MEECYMIVSRKIHEWHKADSFVLFSLSTRLEAYTISTQSCHFSA
jgi:hypothetical protein